MAGCNEDSAKKPGAVDKLTTSRESSQFPDVGYSLQGYRLESILGEGGFGRVYGAVRESDGAKFAIKAIWLSKCEITKPISREISLMFETCHPNIVRLETIFVVDGYMFLVMERLSTDLNDTIQEGALSMQMIKTILYGIIAGVQYLHNRGFVHRDLKPANVLLSGDWKAKLADFGLSRAHLFPGAQVSPLAATPDYSAPELLMGSTEYTTSVDMWSVGCIFAEMLEKEPAFPAMGLFDLFEAGNFGMPKGRSILRSIFRKLGTPSWPGVNEVLEEVYPQQEFEVMAPLEDEGKDLLNRLLCVEPDRRITAKESLAHPFFRDVHVTPV